MHGHACVYQATLLAHLDACRRPRSATLRDCWILWDEKEATREALELAGCCREAQGARAVVEEVQRIMELEFILSFLYIIRQV